MSVPVRLATMAAGLVVAFALAFGVGRVTGGTGADGGPGTARREVGTEVHDMADMADPAGEGDGGGAAEPHGPGQGG